MIDKEKILAGRKAVDEYREAHRILHSKPWHKGISEEHNPLLEKQMAEFKKQGFNTIQGFFDASELLNIQELGFASREDIKTEADREALDRMWH